MKEFYVLLMVLSFVASLAFLPISIWGLVPFSLFILSSLRGLAISKKEFTERKAFVEDILQQNNLLYNSEKGKITYEIDQKTIQIHFHHKDYFKPVLSFTYDKKTGNISQSKRNEEAITKKQAAQLKAFIFSNRKKEAKQKSTQKQTLTPFEKRIEALDTSRKLLLQEPSIEIETMHLLEETFPHDLERVKKMYQESNEEEKENRFHPMLNVMEETLEAIQQKLDVEQEQALDQLEQLLFNRYKIK